MHITVVTLFPEFFTSPLSCGLMGRAQEAGLVSFSFVNPRDFSTDNHRSVDDRPYGGGPGMVMLLEPLSAALKSIPKAGRMFAMNPKGQTFTQKVARELAKEEEITLICGRYEGYDARLEDIFPIESLSVGDFVLNGGESAAINVIEACARLIPGYMGHEESGTEESFSSGTLEYPHYTRPEEFEGQKVPDILRSGDHAKIAAWRREKSLEITMAHRSDLLENAELSAQDVDLLKEIDRKRLGRNLYCVLIHYPVINKDKKSAAVSLTNLDIHDIARCSCTYGMGGYYVSTPIEDQQRLLHTLLSHWKEGAGVKANPDRGEALSLVRGVASLEEAVADIEQRTGQRPLLIATSARGAGSITYSALREELLERPVLLLFGTAHGLSPQILQCCDGMLRPLRYLGDYNHLSVRSAVSIIVDRILGDLL